MVYEYNNHSGPCYDYMMLYYDAVFSLFWSRFSETRAGVMIPPSGLSEYCEILRQNMLA